MAFSFTQGCGGKKSDTQDEGDMQDYFENLEKRAGFVGMRGKKMAELSNKRAGFVGMRGKKWNSARYASPGADYGWYTARRMMRRGGNAGFVGMRG